MLKNAKNANARWTDEGTQSCLPQLTFLTAIFKLGVLHFFLWFLVVGSIVKPMQKKKKQKKIPGADFFKIAFLSNCLLVAIFAIFYQKVNLVLLIISEQTDVQTWN